MKDKINQHPLAVGYLSALLATAIWSGNFIIARGMSTEISPITLAFWRWVVATLVFFPFGIKHVIKEWPTIKLHLVQLTITAILGITLFNTLLYQAGKTSSALNLSLLSITFPIFMILISRLFFNEKLSAKRVLGISMVAFGVIYIITKGNISILLDLNFQEGDIWMILGSLIFAIYSILLRKKPEGISIWSLQLVTFSIGLFFLFPLFLYNLMGTPSVDYNSTTLFAIGYVGIFASLVAFLVWNKAILNIGPTNAGMVYYTLPLFSGGLAFVFLGEPVGMIHFIAATLIISGIVITNVKFKRT